MLHAIINISIWVASSSFILCLLQWHVYVLCLLYTACIPISICLSNVTFYICPLQYYVLCCIMSYMKYLCFIYIHLHFQCQFPTLSSAITCFMFYISYDIYIYSSALLVFVCALFFEVLCFIFYMPHAFFHIPIWVAIVTFILCLLK